MIGDVVTVVDGVGDLVGFKADVDGESGREPTGIGVDDFGNELFSVWSRKTSSIPKAALKISCEVSRSSKIFLIIFRFACFLSSLSFCNAAFFLSTSSKNNSFGVFAAGSSAIVSSVFFSFRLFLVPLSLIRSAVSVSFCCCSSSASSFSCGSPSSSSTLSSSSSSPSFSAPVPLKPIKLLKLWHIC